LNLAQVRKAARDILASGIKVVALVGVFSPLDHEGLHGEQCKKLFYAEAPELQVTCSHSIGPTGYLERENATILNAAILRTGRRVKRGFKRAMARLHLACPLYLSQNGGTLLDADTAAEFPVKTFASGPINSMTDAAFLAGLDCKTRVATDDSAEPQIIVVDIGGTTTDVCALSPSGFPRKSPGFVVTEDLNVVDKCIQPIHEGAANAVGAAIAKISGEIDVVEIPGDRSEKDIIEAVCGKAVDLAVQRGASRENVQIVEVNKMPLQYTPNGAMRIQIRAAGPLVTPTESPPPSSPPASSARTILR